MDHRMHRQTLLIPEGMKQCTVILVGLGMLGSWTAHALARTCKEVIGYDFDTVGEENIGTQAYDDLAIGFPKANALVARLTGLPFGGENKRFEEEDHFLRFMSQHAQGPLVVVSAVDSFAGRRMVAEWAAKYADLFIDTRAAGTVGVVITVPEPEGEWFRVSSPGPTQGEARLNIATYLETLESDEDAPTPACGAEGTAFVGLWVASQVASTLVRYFKGLPVPYKLVYDVGMGDELVREDAPMATA